MRGGGGHYAGATVQVAESSWGMATMHTQFGWGQGPGTKCPQWWVGGFLWNATYSGAREGGGVPTVQVALAVGAKKRGAGVVGSSQPSPSCAWGQNLKATAWPTNWAGGYG